MRVRLALIADHYPPQFMDVLIPPALVSFLKPKECTTFLLTCGALVSVKESCEDLLKAVRS
jgi:hypothetical protein